MNSLCVKSVIYSFGRENRENRNYILRQVKVGGTVNKNSMFFH